MTVSSTLTAAGTAPTSAVLTVASVLFVIWMAPFARRFLCGTANVLAPCDWFKMIGIHATSVAAKMINCQSFRYRSAKHLPSHTMSVEMMRSDATDVAVSIRQGRRPFPTPVGTVLVDFAPKSVLQRDRFITLPQTNVPTHITSWIPSRIDWVNEGSTSTCTLNHTSLSIQPIFRNSATTVKVEKEVQ